jgi:hypothetical protein
MYHQSDLTVNRFCCKHGWSSDKAEQLGSLVIGSNHSNRLAWGGHTAVVHPCDRRRASARRRGPSLTPPDATGLVPGRRARPAGRRRRCGPCARGALPAAGPCRGAWQRGLGSRPTTAALRRGESVARRGDLQGKFLLASGQGSHGWSLTSQEPGVRRHGRHSRPEGGWAGTGAIDPMRYANIIIIY